MKFPASLDWLRCRILLKIGTLGVLALSLPSLHAADLPREPMDIGTQPQFFVDDTIVDNRWSVKQRTEEVLRVAHQPVKHAGNPVIAGEGGYVSVAREADTGVFRLWYQTSSGGGEDDAKTAIYAESTMRACPPYAFRPRCETLVPKQSTHPLLHETNPLRLIPQV